MRYSFEPAADPGVDLTTKGTGPRKPRRPVSLALLLCLICAAGCTPVPPGDCPAGFERTEGLCVQDIEPALSIFTGDLWIDTPEDAAEFCADFNAVQGDLTLAPDLVSADELGCLLQVAGDLILEELGAMQLLALPQLYWVGGHLSLQGSTAALEEVRLDSLQGIGGGLTVHVNELIRLKFPMLDVVEGHVSFYSNVRMEELSLPLLTEVGLDDEEPSVLYVRLNHELTALDLPSLEWVSGVLKISSNRSMTDLWMPSLYGTGSGVYISYCEVLTSYSLPLESVGGFLYLANSFAQSIALPHLESISDDLNVIFNMALSDVEMPNLEFVGNDVVFASNPLLAEGTIDQLLEGVVVGGDVRREDNG